MHLQLIYSVVFAPHLNYNSVVWNKILRLNYSSEKLVVRPDYVPRNSHSDPMKTQINKFIF